MSVCPSMPFDVGIVRDILGSVDCNVQYYAAAGYRALAGPASPLPAALTGLLTVYVAVLGYRMMLGIGGRLSDTPLIAIQIGAILALTLNWNVFQTLVFNLDSEAPLRIGRVISAPMARGVAGALASDPVSGIQTAYDEFNADAAELAAKKTLANVAAGPPDPAAPQSNEAATAADLRRAAAALLSSTAGVLAMAFIATGVLTAVGPVFIALFMFDATRGFCIGWIRALVSAMLIPMVCWITTSLLMVILGPRIDTLAQQRAAHAINLDTAAAASAIVVIFAAAQGALIVAVLLVAGGFRIGRRATAPVSAPSSAREPQAPGQAVAEAPSRAQTLAASLQRSGASYSREYTAAAAMAAPDRADPTPPQGLDDPARPVRLGETYRQGAPMRDRRRVSAAGRA